jgi:uncharacterized protein YneF (UPF0154 family)
MNLLKDIALAIIFIGIFIAIKTFSNDFGRNKTR